MLDGTDNRVLVIDDDSDIGEEICDALAGKGWNGTYARNIDEARRYLIKEAGPRIVIVDFHMPGLNGIEMIETLQREATNRLVFIMLTGDDSQSTAISAVRAQAFDFLRKPVVAPVVTDAVDRAATHLSRLLDADSRTEALTSEAAALKRRINGISEMLRHRESMVQQLLMRDHSALDHPFNGALNGHNPFDTAPLECIPVDISTLMQCMLPAIQRLSGKKQVQVKSRVPSNLPFLYGDRRRIGRALADLSAVLINDMSKGDRITILAVKDDHELVVSFKINSPVSAKKYYGAFTADLSDMVDRVDDSRESPELTLLATRMVVLMHGGRMAIEDNAGSELSVRIFFPLPSSDASH